MKLFNVIQVFDVYAVAETEMEAVRIVDEFVRTQGLETSDAVAHEAREEKNVREAWCEQKPMVGADVSDADFERLKGKTTTEIHAMLYKKEPAAKKAAAKK